MDYPTDEHISSVNWDWHERLFEPQANAVHVIIIDHRENCQDRRIYKLFSVAKICKVSHLMARIAHRSFKLQCGLPQINEASTFTATCVDWCGQAQKSKYPHKCEGVLLLWCLPAYSNPPQEEQQFLSISSVKSHPLNQPLKSSLCDRMSNEINSLTGRFLKGFTHSSICWVIRHTEGELLAVAVQYILSPAELSRDNWRPAMIIIKIKFYRIQDAVIVYPAAMFGVMRRLLNGEVGKRGRGLVESRN